MADIEGLCFGEGVCVRRLFFLGREQSVYHGGQAQRSYSVDLPES